MTAPRLGLIPFAAGNEVQDGPAGRRQAEGAQRRLVSVAGQRRHRHLVPALHRMAATRHGVGFRPDDAVRRRCQGAAQPITVRGTLVGTAGLAVSSDAVGPEFDVATVDEARQGAVVFGGTQEEVETPVGRRTPDPVNILKQDQGLGIEAQGFEVLDYRLGEKHDAGAAGLLLLAHR